MRSKIFIAVMATAIGMSSCEWFASKKQSPQALNIEGKWKVDSIFEGNDSGKIKDHSSLALFSQMHDSSQMKFEFSKDSVIAISDKPDTLSYKLDNKQIAFKRKDDSTEQIFSFSSINDSVISFKSTDSSSMILKRTK